jgi:MFS family permease
MALDLAVTPQLASVPTTRRRWFVFAALLSLTFGIWLDEAKFSTLAAFWAASLHLNAAQVANVSSAYLLGYAPMLLVAGALADWIGPRRLLLISGAGVTVLSASMVLVTTYDEMWWRNLVFGLFFALLWAPSNRMLAIWFPAHERTKVTSIWLGAANAAAMLAPLIALPIAHHVSWQAAFLVVAAFCVPALVAVFKTTDRPADLPRISAAELRLIDEGRPVSTLTASVGDVLRVLRRPSVLLVSLGGLLISPIWLVLTWAPYGLVALDKVNPDVVGVVVPLIMLVPFTFAFANGAVLRRFFGGRTKVYMAVGMVFGGLALLGAAVIPMNWVLWSVLLVGAALVCNIAFYGTVNTYFAGLVGPQLTGIVNGLTAFLQVVGGYTLVKLSGGWFDATATGHAQLSKVFLIGGAILVAAALPLLCARKVVVTEQRVAAGQPGAEG